MVNFQKTQNVLYWSWLNIDELQLFIVLDWWSLWAKDSQCVPRVTSWVKKDSVIDCQVQCNQTNHKKLTFNRASYNCACCDILASVQPTSSRQNEVYIYHAGNI